MKRALPLLGAGALLTATALRLVAGPSLPATVQAPSPAEQKRLAFRCAPAYLPSEADPIPALTGWGNYRWKVGTASDSAQYYFNQGMAMYYAFHIVESRASFDKAVRFDPQCAMAWWGKALAFGPNINDFGYQQPSEAFASAQKARALKDNSTLMERALIDVMAVRYSADSTDQQLLNQRYLDGMALVAKRFATNADVSALYADAQMLLHPWDLYAHDFTPRPWTPKIIATVQQALKSDPRHVGAHHYYIHLLEASSRPEKALQSANYLSNAMPSVAHVTHMPSHIFIRTGYYSKGIRDNDKALTGYRNYVQQFAPAAEGLPLYVLHNLHMKMACAQMAGNYEQALSAATELQSSIPSEYLGIEGALGNYVQYLHAAPLFTLVRFGKWDEILAQPAAEQAPYAKLLRQFARGMALARTGSLQPARDALASLKVLLANDQLKEPYTPFSSAYEAGQVALHLLEGAVAEAAGEPMKAIGHYEEAVKAEDALVYNEPRDWVLPARHYLSAALLRVGRHTEAMRILQEDLRISPQNGWALTGIRQALEKQKKTKEATQLSARIRTAWSAADTKIQAPVF